MINHCLSKQGLKTRRIFSIREQSASVDSPVVYRLGLSLPFRMSLAYSAYNMSPKRFERRYGIDRIVDVDLRHATLALVWTGTICSTSHKVEQPFSRKSSNSDGALVSSSEGSTLHIFERTPHSKLDPLSKLWPANEEAQFFREGEVELVDKGVIGFPLASSNNLLASYRMFSFCQALSMLICDHLDPPYIPGTPDSTSNRNVG